MIFDALWEAAKHGELLLIDGGFCHWHLRRDGQLTIYEIISTRPGAGRAMLTRLTQTPGARCIVAKCPADLAANSWYQRRGFELTSVETARSGRAINVWTLQLSSTVAAETGDSTR